MRFWLTTVAIAAFLALQLLLPYQGTKELAFVPQQVRYFDKQTLIQTIDNAAQLKPFLQENFYGYHSLDMQSFSYTEFNQSSSITRSQDFVLAYSEGKTEIIDSLGNKLGEFPSNGQVFIRNGQIYEISFSSHQLKAFDRQGRLQWQSAFLSPLTAVNYNGKQTSFSSVNGEVTILNEDGLLDLRQSYSGSRVNTIYGHAITQDAQYLAMIAGLEPQRIQILQLIDGVYYPMFTKELKQEQRSSYWMNFSVDFPILFYRLRNSLILNNYSLKKELEIPIEGQILNFLENPERSLQMLLTRNEDQGMLMVSLGVNGVLLRLEIERRPYSLSNDENDVYLSLENAIARYTILEI